jgi:hypothetical protein
MLASKTIGRWWCGPAWVVSVGVFLSQMVVVFLKDHLKRERCVKSKENNKYEMVNIAFFSSDMVFLFIFLKLFQADLSISHWKAQNA